LKKSERGDRKKDPGRPKAEALGYQALFFVVNIQGPKKAPAPSEKT